MPMLSLFSGLSEFGLLIRLNLSLPLLVFIDHCEFGILFTNKLFGEIKLFNQKPFDFHHDNIVLILLQEIGVEGILGGSVASDEQGDADEESCLQDIIVVDFLNMFT